MSTSSLLKHTGRVLGVSGILDAALWESEARGSRWAILVGMASAPAALNFLAGLTPGRISNGDEFEDWAASTIDIDAGQWFWRQLGWARIGVAALCIGFGSKVILS